jgi:2-polyprenyl-3-methyl-5-hydroxy-6-metoxy-1,4-benzoquinol methylase
MTTLTDHPTTASAEAFAEQVFGAAQHALEMLSAYLGDRLGYYRALAEQGPATPDELAARTGTHPRYAREWLEQQAVIGWLQATPGDHGRRYQMPDGVAEVMTDGQSLLYSAPLARLFGLATQLPALLRAYRTGGGVPWSQFGADARESIAELNHPWFTHALPGALRATASIDRILRRPGARIADIGCGAGSSTVALARTYPEATVDGYDIDEPAIAMARERAQAEQVDDRVFFHTTDAADLTGAYDVVFAFECVHDMPRPVEALAAARRALRPGGTVVVMDEAVGDTFTAPGDVVEQFCYSVSLLVCLPDAMAHQPSAATGTVMRPDTLRAYARAAGFTGVDVLPITDFGMWRFYRLML